MSYSASQLPFAPLGNTIKITADTTAPTGVQAPVFTGQNEAGQFRFFNSHASNIIVIGYGATAAEATANAVSGATGKCFSLRANFECIMRFNKDTYFSAYAASSCSLYITPGQGL